MLNQYRFHSGQFQIGLETFELTGSDVNSFLQSQTTNNIDLLNVGEFQLAALLDPQGRTECYGWLLNAGEKFFYLVPYHLRDSAIERLNRFLISEDVTITEPLAQRWTFVLGPEAPVVGHAFRGVLFDESVLLLREEIIPGIPQIPISEINQWRSLTGWPSFTGEDFSKDLINNTRLFDLSVMMNKGCYPGQETVSKIATRRGAAYAPVLLEVSKQLEVGEISNFEKRIGTLGECHSWEGKFFSTASLLRDFRVEGMKIAFSLNGTDYVGTVRYYPLIKGSVLEKAREAYHLASQEFMRDNLTSSEELFRLAIKFDPTFADAYEGLGVMLGRQERFPEALEVMKKLSEIDPSSVLAHTNMSLFLMRLGKIEEAEEQKSLATVKSFQQFGKEAKEKEALELQKKAKMDEWLKRESMFQEVLAIDEEDTLANYGIGSIAVEKGEWDRALLHLEKVIKVDPKYSVAYLALGKAYLGLGRKAEARDTWSKGISIAATKGDLMPANQMQSELDSLR